MVGRFTVFAYNRAMPKFESATVEVLFYIVALVAAVALLWLGYRFGKWVATMSSAKLIASKEQELFTAQKGFKNLYDQEVSQLRTENADLKARLQTLEGRVEHYRRKAAGLGGLFTSGGKRAEAMYALLLENEALEEALYSQNEKLRQERTDALKETLRNASYRRVLISQLLADDRVKGVVNEVLTDEKQLPGIPEQAKALPGTDQNPEDR